MYALLSAECKDWPAPQHEKRDCIMPIQADQMLYGGIHSEETICNSFTSFKRCNVLAHLVGVLGSSITLEAYALATVL
jgi:hypothetical protein